MPIFMSTQILTICGVVTGIAAVFVILWKAIAFLMSIYKRVLCFLDDWQGEPDREGVPGRKSVMARLGAIEHEVKRNDGSSLKDAVHRIEQKQAEYIGNQTEANAQAASAVVAAEAAVSVAEAAVAAAVDARR